MLVVAMVGADARATTDLGIHKTDLIQYLTSQTVTETQAFITTLDKKDASNQLIGVDDNGYRLRSKNRRRGDMCGMRKSL